MTREFKIGFAGTNRSAGFLNAFSAIPQTRIAAFCDIIKERAEKVALDYNAQYFTEFEQMIEKGHLDAVVIATPMQFHASQAIQSLEKNISVLSEVTAAVSIAEAKKGETVLMNGFGGLGSNALQIAHTLGLETIAIDVSKDKLKVASEMGAKAVINAATQNVPEEVRKFTNGEGVDIALEFVGKSATIENAFKSLRKEGRLVFIGYTKDNFNFSPLELIISELSIKGSVAYTKNDLDNVVKLAEQRRLTPIISKSYRIDETNQALQEIAKGDIMGRAVVKPDEK